MCSSDLLALHLEWGHAPANRPLRERWPNDAPSHLEQQEPTMKPRIPMSPAQLPRQRLYVVTDMPPRPAHFLTRCGYGFSSVPEFQPPPRKPSRAHLVCMLEWAWSPAHNRLTAYYLCRNRTRSHWMLWSSSPAEDYWYGSKRWESHLLAYGPSRGVEIGRAHV